MHENLTARKRKVTMPRGNRSKRENYLSRKTKVCWKGRV
jgi:hypothetical protein